MDSWRLLTIIWTLIDFPMWTSILYRDMIAEHLDKRHHVPPTNLLAIFKSPTLDPGFMPVQSMTEFNINTWVEYVTDWATYRTQLADRNCHQWRLERPEGGSMYLGQNLLLIPSSVPRRWWTDPTADTMQLGSININLPVVCVKCKKSTTNNHLGTVLNSHLVACWPGGCFSLSQRRAKYLPTWVE